MYHEIKTKLPSSIDAIWYADSSDEGVGYSVAPELGANLVIKLYSSCNEVILTGAITKQQSYPYIPDAQYFGIRFQPGYRFPETLASLHDLQNTSITIPKLMLKKWDCLDERLRHKATVCEQLSELHYSLLTITHDTVAIPDLIQDALYQIHRHHGMIKVHTLSQITMVGERQLERLFKTYLGLSPKAVCNIVRIRQLLDVLWQSPERPQLTDLALQFGYTDQAHLANNFRTIIGMSISDYLRQ